jgi:D-amino-acid dehydrogenase
MMPLPAAAHVRARRDRGYDTMARRAAQAFIAGFTGLFRSWKCLERSASAPVLLPASVRRTAADPRPLTFANLYYNTGQGHLGWTLAHGSARIVAAQIAGRDPGIDLSGLRPAAGQ